MKTVKAAKCLNMCDRNCENCKSCNSLNIYSLRELVHKSKIFLAHFAEKTVFFEFYGYRKPPASLGSRVDTVRNNLPSVERYLKAIRGGYTPCLCPSELDNIYQRIDKEVNTLPCTEGDMNEENLDLEVFQPLDPKNINSSCIPYEPWERAVFLRMPEVGYTVDIKKCVRFLYDLKVSTEVLDPEFIIDFSVEVKKACNIDYKVDIDLQQCKIEFDKISKLNSCDISLDTYSKVRECGISYDTVSKLLECSVEPFYDKKSGEIVFLTQEGNKYTTQELLSLHKVKIK